MWTLFEYHDEILEDSPSSALGRRDEFGHLVERAHRSNMAWTKRQLEHLERHTENLGALIGELMGEMLPWRSSLRTPGGLHGDGKMRHRSLRPTRRSCLMTSPT